jgi:hypothetical protein
MSKYRTPCLIEKVKPLFFGILFATAWLACNENNPATVAESTYRLTVLAGSGGTITAPTGSIAEVRKGGSTTISARANRGFTFARWTVSGENATVTYQNAADAAVTLTGDDTVRAEFIAVPALPAPIDLSSIPTENGVNFARYAGSWSKLPDFSTLSAQVSGPGDSLGLYMSPGQANGFGLELSGYLVIALDGNYTFYLASSDGSSLYLNDSAVLVSDGIHATPKEDSVTVALLQGDYLIGVHYFAGLSAPYLGVAYACVDNGIEKTAIPKDALVRADTRPSVKITVTRPAGGETFRLGDTIHVRWAYKNPRGQVYAQLSVDNGKRFKNISVNAFPGNVSSYDWQIPPGADSLVTQTALIRVEEYSPFTVKGVSKMFSIVGR